MQSCGGGQGRGEEAWAGVVDLLPRGGNAEDLQCLVGIVSLAAPTDLYMDGYSETPVCTVDPSSPVGAYPSKGVRRSGNRTTMSMVHLVLHAVACMCSAEVGLGRLDELLGCCCCLLRSTLLSGGAGLESLGLKRSTGPPEEALVSAVRAHSVELFRALQAGQAAVERLCVLVGCSETCANMSLCMVGMSQLLYRCPTLHVGAGGDPVLRSAAGCLPPAAACCLSIPHDSIRGKTYVQSVDDCLLFLLVWLGNARVACTSRSSSDCIEDKFFAQSLWGFVGCCRSMMGIGWREPILERGPGDRALSECLGGPYGCLVDVAALCECMVVSSGVWEERVSLMLSAMDWMDSHRAPGGPMVRTAGVFSAVCHLVGSLVQCMGTVSAGHSFRLLLCEAYCLIAACTEMFAGADLSVLLAGGGSVAPVALHRFGVTRCTRAEEFFSPFVECRESVQSKGSVYDSSWMSSYDLRDVSWSILSRSMCPAGAGAKVGPPVVHRVHQECPSEMLSTLPLLSMEPAGRTGYASVVVWGGA